jgi:hypothetical protein
MFRVAASMRRPATWAAMIAAANNRLAPCRRWAIHHAARAARWSIEAAKRFLKKTKKTYVGKADWNLKDLSG